MRILSLEFKSDSEINISSIPLIGGDFEGSLNLLPSVHRKVILDVEDGLLPMCVRGFWRCGEANLLVRFGEINAEVGDEGVDVVVTSTAQREVYLKRKVFNLDCVEIKLFDYCVVGDNLRIIQSQFQIIARNTGLGGRLQKKIEKY